VREDGFSLVELLVIMAVVSVILLVVFNGFSVSIRTSYHSVCSSKGAMIAQRYSSMFKAGLDVPEEVKVGNYLLKFKNVKISGDREAKVIVVLMGRRKCVELPVK